MFDGVLAGPEGRWGLKSRSGTETLSERLGLSKAGGFTRLLPRGLPDERDDHVDAYPEDRAPTEPASDCGDDAVGVGWPSSSSSSEAERTM